MRVVLGQGEVEVAGVQGRDGVLLVALHHRRLDPGEGPELCMQRGDDEPADGGREGGEADRSTVRVMDAQQVGLGLGEDLRQPVGVSGELPAGRGELGRALPSASGAVQQDQARLALEGCQALGDPERGQVESVPRSHDFAGFRDGPQDQ